MKNIDAEKEIISYLTFSLNSESFALNVGNVINILEMQSVTKLPKSPDYINGIINLRGEVLPVINTNKKLELNDTEITSNTCILVIETLIEQEKIKFGAMVDSVQEVLEFDNENILPSPTIGKNYNSDLIEGVVEQEDKFIMLIDINKLLDTNEATALKKIGKTIQN